MVCLWLSFQQFGVWVAKECGEGLRLMVHFKSLMCLNYGLGYHFHQGGCYMLLEKRL